MIALHNAGLNPFIIYSPVVIRVVNGVRTFEKPSTVSIRRQPQGASRLICHSLPMFV